MATPSRGYRAVASILRASRNPRICSDCIKKSQHRSYAVAAATLSTSEGTIPSPQIAQIPPVTQTGTVEEYEVNSAVVLSRPPIITRPLTPFENEYFLYQKRLNERLSLPFTRYFYHKSDTPQDTEWKRKVKRRNGVASRDVGGYQAYTEQSWNDEVLVGSDLSKPTKIVDALLKDLESEEVEGMIEAQKIQIEKPEERFTEADKKKDYKRLDRKLARTLYLCVQKQEGDWVFPQGRLRGKESLHAAAERILVQSAGLNMNTWIVGQAPIGHHVDPPKLAADNASIEKSGLKTFFMKGRIMAGQADLTKNRLGLQDFKWLTKEELRKAFSTQYYSYIWRMLADR